MLTPEMAGCLARQVRVFPLSDFLPVGVAGVSDRRDASSLHRSRMTLYTVDHSTMNGLFNLVQILTICPSPKSFSQARAPQVKEAYPSLPLIFHTHYQTGYGYMAYLEAVKNGANGVECSLGFPDGAGQVLYYILYRQTSSFSFVHIASKQVYSESTFSIVYHALYFKAVVGNNCCWPFPSLCLQPFGLTMLRTFEDMGFHTGNPDKAAMNKLSEFCKTMRPLYPQVRTHVARRCPSHPLFIIEKRREDGSHDLLGIRTLILHGLSWISDERGEALSYSILC